MSDTAIDEFRLFIETGGGHGSLAGLEFDQGMRLSSPFSLSSRFAG